MSRQQDGLPFGAVLIKKFVRTEHSASGNRPTWERIAKRAPFGSPSCLSINPSFYISRKKVSAFIQVIPCAIFFLPDKGTTSPCLIPFFLFRTSKKSQKTCGFLRGHKGAEPPCERKNSAQTVALMKSLVLPFAQRYCQDIGQKETFSTSWGLPLGARLAFLLGSWYNGCRFNYFLLPGVNSRAFCQC